MKNLKKVLALVLAFACAFTMFAGAAFTDQADINTDNVEAVDLLTTLGIIKGYEDGSFDPEGTVDRAEMAKMIYTIRNGGNDNASAHVGNTTSFTDISGHWAEGYIKYLQNTGIVAGKSATQFAPDAQVTTAEAMKMALALAGYDEVNAGLTGIDWQKNTLTYATTIGLTDDVNSAMSAGCSRQDAAQILANVLEANAVRYSAIVENFVNDSKTGLSYGGDPITVGYKWMDLTVYVGKLVSSGELNIDGVADAGKDRFSVVVDTVNNVEWNRWNWNDVRDYWNRADRTLTVKDGQDHTDLVGQEVKLLTGEKIDDVYGVYATGTSNVVETTMDQIDVENNWELSIGNDTYDTRGAAVYADLNTAADVEDVFTNNGEAVADTVKLIDWDNDDDYETILVNTVAVAEVSYVGSSSVTLGSYGARVDDILDNDLVLDIDDNTIYEDIAKDDYAVATMNTYNDSWIVEKAETVSGEVNGRVANERKVCINDTWYTLANNKISADSADHKLYTINGSRHDFSNGDDIMLVIVGDIAYYAKSSTGNDANRSVAMIYDKAINGGNWNTTRQVKVLAADGTDETVDLDTDNGLDFDKLIRGAIYYYDINNDDEWSFYELGKGANEKDAGYDDVIDNTKGVTGSRAAGYTIADEAIVFAFINDNGSYDAKLYTGKTVKDAKKTEWGAMADNGKVLTEEDSGFEYARMLNVSITPAEELDTTTNYGYMVTDSVWKTVDGVKVMEYTYWNGSEIVTSLQKTNANREDQIEKGRIIAFAPDGDGYIKDVKWVPADLGLEYAAMSGQNGDDIGVVRTSDGVRRTYEVDSDTVAFYVNSDASNMEDIGVSGEGYNYDLRPDENDVYDVNIAYILNNDKDKIKFIVIDVDGQLDTKYNDKRVQLNVGAVDDDDEPENPDEVATMPETEDGYNITLRPGMKVAGMAYNNGYVYFQLRDTELAGVNNALIDYEITDNKGGSDFGDVEVMRDENGDFNIIRIPYTPSEGATTIRLELSNAVADSYAVTVKDDQESSVLVLDQASIAADSKVIKATVDLPAGVQSFENVRLGVTGATIDVANTKVAGSAYAAGTTALEDGDVVEIALNAAPTGAIVVSVSGTVTFKASVDASAVQNIDPIETNIHEVVANQPTKGVAEGAKATTDGSIDFTLVETATANDKINVYYTVNGSDEDVVNATCTASKNKTVELKYLAAAVNAEGLADVWTNGVQIVVTKVEFAMQVNARVDNTASSGSLDGTVKKAVIKGGDSDIELTDSAADQLLTIGKEYTLELTLGTVASEKTIVIKDGPKDVASIKVDTDDSNETVTLNFTLPYDMGASFTVEADS